MPNESFRKVKTKHDLKKGGNTMLTRYEILRLASAGACEQWYHEHTKNEELKQMGIYSEIREHREAKAWQALQEINKMMTDEEKKRLQAAD